MPRKLKLKGLRFRKLLVLGEYPKRTNGFTHWLCRCDCGKLTVVIGRNLTTSNTGSCGCLLQKGQPTHGLSRSKLYEVWRNMKYRCSSPNHLAYPNYGGRGIKVCPKWEKDFKAFYNFAVANGWQEGLTIDRIDNNKGYHPANVRFATMKEQIRNRRGSRLPSGP